MDDQALVSELHRVARSQEDGEPLVDPELMFVAVVEERRAGDMLHDQVRAAVRCGASVDQPRDVGVIEHREDLPLGAESLQDLFRAHAGLDQLDRDLFGEALVVPRGAIDHAHSAAADLFEDAVGAEPVARGDGRAEPWGGGRVEKIAGLVVCGEQRSHFRGQGRVRLGDLREEGIPRGGLQLQGLVKEAMDPIPGSRSASGMLGGRRQGQRIDSGIVGWRRCHGPPSVLAYGCQLQHGKLFALQSAGGRC